MKTDLLKWEDVTSYSRGERGNVPPRVLKTYIEGVEVNIHRVNYNKNTWYMNCHALNVDRHDLHTDNFSVAEKIALRVFIERIDKFMIAQRMAISKLNEWCISNLEETFRGTEE